MREIEEINPVSSPKPVPHFFCKSAVVGKGLAVEQVLAGLLKVTSVGDEVPDFGDALELCDFRSREDASL